VAALDGGRVVAGTREGTVAAAQPLGTSLAEELLARGADLVGAAGEVR